MNEQNDLNVLDPQAKPACSCWFRRTGPTVLVLALLGGVAILGNRLGWTAPKFANLLGLETNEKDDWCEEHGVPDEICIECNETLLPKLKTTWCRAHGVHNCPFERSDVAQTRTPEPVRQDDLDRAQRALDLKERKENNPKCKLHERRIQVASVEILDKMGVAYWEPVAREPISETVSASGAITFEQPRIAPASAPVAGRVWLVTDKGVIGAQVQRGDVLALLDAAEVGKAKTELLQAFAQVELRKKTLDRLAPIADSGALPQARLAEAETALREARIRLLGAQQTLNNMGLPIPLDDSKPFSVEELTRRVQFHGIPADIAARLDAKKTTATLMPVIASRAGTVTAVKATLGEMAEPGKPLFVVADTSRMWLMLNVRLEDVRYLRVRDPRTHAPGQTVKFRADGGAREVVGELVWKSAEVDEKTRTVQVRAELPNADGTLLANTFGVGQIVVRAEKDAIVVPSEAVHWEGDCHVVFVRDKNFLEPNGLKVFHVRTVRPGVINGANTEIIAGLLPGEIVAAKNSASLRVELLKNKLGAGCGCAH